MANKGYEKPRPEWNRLGPPLPLWFRMGLRRIDPKLTLQFRPPMSEEHPDGVRTDVSAYGVWDICYRMPRTGFLHPRAVWSLTDSDGNFAQPDPSVLRTIRLALMLQRQHRTHEMEARLDRAMSRINAMRAEKSSKALRASISEYCSIHFGRQFQNRVYLRKTVPKAGTEVGNFQ